MKGKITNILLVLILVAGLSLMLYPTVSSAYNAYLQSLIIAEYSDQVNETAEAARREAMEAAGAYNAALLDRQDPFRLTGEMEARYWDLLDTGGQGVMAYIEIPSIAVNLPIAHGTEKRTLSSYVGHIEWSSLPVGGESTHCVISGHRGLPSSELFTNIDHLELGDKFYIHVLGRTLEYRINNISVVDPYDYSQLGITEGADYCTLVTCTPYGVNSHRLLVRGVRVDTQAVAENGEIDVWNEVHPIAPAVVVPVCLAFLVVAAVLMVLVRDGLRSVRRRGKYLRP